MEMNEFKTMTLLVLCAVVEIPEGIPSGHIYATSMSKGVSLDEHQKMIEILKSAGWATCSGHLIKATDKGREVVAKVEAALKAKGI